MESFSVDHTFLDVLYLLDLQVIQPFPLNVLLKQDSHETRMSYVLLPPIYYNILNLKPYCKSG